MKKIKKSQIAKYGLKNHQTFDDILLNCCDWSGAKEYTSCKSRKNAGKNQKNEYLKISNIHLQRSASIQPRTGRKQMYDSLN